MYKLPVCEECERPSIKKKPTCCKMLFEARFPKAINWSKSFEKWTRELSKGVKRW